MTKEEFLKRRIFLKKQHIIIINDDIRDLEKELKALSEKERKEEIPL